MLAQYSVMGIYILISFMSLSIDKIPDPEEIAGLWISRIIGFLTFFMCTINLFTIIVGFTALWGQFIWYILIGSFLITYIFPVIFFINQIKFLFKEFGTLLVYIWGMSFYLVTLQTYAVANIHNFTWGNRDTGIETHETDEEKRKGEMDTREFNFIRVLLYFFWLSLNYLVAVLQTNYVDNKEFF